MTTKIGSSNSHLDVDFTAAKAALKEVGLPTTVDNVMKLIEVSVDKNHDDRLTKSELKKGAKKLLGEAAPALPTAATVLTQALTSAIAPGNVPFAVQTNYSFKLSSSGNKLTIDPPELPMTRGPLTRSSRGFHAETSARGGKIIELEGGPFKNGGWLKASFADLVKDPDRLADLMSAGYDVNKQRDMLVVNGKKDPEPTIFAFSNLASNRGIVAVCSEVTVMDFSEDPTGKPTIMVRKPVVYIYPEKKTSVSVKVELDGEFVSQYPKAKDGTWEVVATPNGTLFDPITEKRYSYLFWEGTNATFEIDAKQAFCVSAQEAEAFLEKACDRFGLNDKEKTDFVSYWLPHLEKNPLSMVQFLDTETYERYARMTVNPKPETVIRMFMVFERIPERVPTGSPELPQLSRKGFTVVEWGGSNLDEKI